MKVLSLFAGIGGFDLAFERAGCTVVAQVESDPQFGHLESLIAAIEHPEEAQS